MTAARALLCVEAVLGSREESRIRSASAGELLEIDTRLSLEVHFGSLGPSAAPPIGDLAYRPPRGCKGVRAGDAPADPEGAGQTKGIGLRIVDTSADETPLAHQRFAEPLSRLMGAAARVQRSLVGSPASSAAVGSSAHPNSISASACWRRKSRCGSSSTSSVASESAPAAPHAAAERDG
jgi:hypothetical protein